MNLPLLSVVLINWNAKKYICNCINSVFNSSYQNLEIILVDNYSTDGSLDELRFFLGDKFTKIKLIINDKNYGPAYAVNVGVKETRGKYISFLATDTKVDKECFSELVKIMESDKSIGAVESKLLLLDEPNRFDHAGEYLNQFGLLLQRHADQNIDRGQLDYITDIFSAKGTALTVVKEAFKKAEGIDTSYFMFLEETDLCWRIWLSGYRILFVPSAKIYHASGTSINSAENRNYLAKYYGSRNYITTLFKNLGFKNLLMIIPVHVGMWFLLSLWLAIHLRIKEGLYILEGIGWNIINLGKILEKRRNVQSKRVISDIDLMPKIMRRIKLSYLFDRVRAW
jgi:hypothetical protein